MKTLAGVLMIGLLLVPAPAARADEEECRAATQHYAAALAEASDALADYTHCLEASRGHDACGSEFLRLQLAQDDFAAGVAAFQSRCP